MTDNGLTKQRRITTYPMMTRTIAMGLALGMMVATSGCINVTAPDKPIEINLNINVTQEVVYRLDGDAKSLIKQNPGIF